MNNTGAGDVFFRGPLLNNLDIVIIVTVSLSVNMILSLPLNYYVLWLMFSGARETLVSDFFSVNLAVSEIIFSLSTTWYLFFANLNCVFCLGVFTFGCGLLLTARPLFQCCICVECYVGVVYPVLYLRFKPLRYKIMVCCVVWLVSVISCIYFVVTQVNRPYLYGYFVQSVLCLCVMLFCCLSVLVALRRPGPGQTETEKKTSNAKKRKAFKIILLIMVSLALYLILYIVAIPLQCCLEMMVFYKFFMTAISIALATGFLQPLLYLNRSGKLPCFRKT